MPPAPATVTAGISPVIGERPPIARQGEFTAGRLLLPLARADHGEPQAGDYQPGEA